MSDQEIIKRLQQIIQDIVECDGFVLTQTTKFEELGLSSFGMVQLVCAIEDAFDIEIPNTAIKTIKSMPAAVKFIKKELKSKV